MNPERIKQIEQFLANPKDIRFGPGATYAYPRPEELAQYDTIMANNLAVDTQAAPPSLPAGGDQRIATAPPPAPVPIAADGQAILPEAVAEPMPVDPNISPVTGRPRSMFSQQRRAEHDAFMQRMSDYLASGGQFPSMGPRPTMPGQPAPGPDFPMGPMPMDPSGMPMRSGPPSMPSSMSSMGPAASMPSSLSNGPSRPMQNSFPSRSMPGQSLRPESSYSPPPAPMPVTSSRDYERPRSMPRVSGSPTY